MEETRKLKDNMEQIFGNCGISTKRSLRIFGSKIQFARDIEERKKSTSSKIETHSMY